MEVSVRAVVIRGNKLLVMGRNNGGVKYVSLPGGTVEEGETNEQAVIREVKEETLIEIKNPRLIITEDEGEKADKQYMIYLCKYVKGEPELDPASPEYMLNAQGNNLYTPYWLSVEDLPASGLLPKQLKDLLANFIKNGFPSTSVKLQLK